ncbi:hypothetical protein C4588_05630 [Candidatus Parcubacteria bacterium]|nr:MAG: hypothetical protein C4588_05630 [Candidatus Parcubacteria bacterium]
MPKTVVNPTVLAGAPMTIGANLIAATKIAGIGASFFYLQKKLDTNPSFKNSKSIRKASYFLPLLGLPYVVELITKEEWPLLGTLFQVGMSGLAIKTALETQN